MNKCTQIIFQYVIKGLRFLCLVQFDPYGHNIYNLLISVNVSKLRCCGDLKIAKENNF